MTNDTIFVRGEESDKLNERILKRKLMEYAERYKK